MKAKTHIDDFSQNSESSHSEHKCKRPLLKYAGAFVGRGSEEEETGEAQENVGERDIAESWLLALTKGCLGASQSPQGPQPWGQRSIDLCRLESSQ